MDGHAERRRTAGPRLARRLAGLTVTFGVLYAFGALAYTLNAATRAGAEVVVEVTVKNPAAVRYPSASEPGRGQVVLLGSEQDVFPSNPRLDLVDPPASSPVLIETDVTTAALRAQDSTLAEQVLSRAHHAFRGVCIGLGALLLRSLLLSIAQGQPFRPGNASRIVWIGGLALVGGAGGMILRVAASRTVLSRLDIPREALEGTVTVDLTLLVVVAFVLVLAEAFRRGGELARDAEGLV